MSVARWLGVAAVALVVSAEAASARIVKVLPHFLDKQGRHTIHPSLFERDAYQAQLRRAPELQSTMRFDVQWKAKSDETPLRLRVETRGEKTAAGAPETIEREIRKGGLFSRWTSITVPKETFERLGGVVAWRVSVWNGETLLAEERSFLW